MILCICVSQYHDRCYSPKWLLISKVKVDSTFKSVISVSKHCQICQNFSKTQRISKNNEKEEIWNRRRETLWTKLHSALQKSKYLSWYSRFVSGTLGTVKRMSEDHFQDKILKLIFCVRRVGFPDTDTYEVNRKVSCGV